MTSSENSALTALAELKNLERNRQQQKDADDAKRSAEAAARRAENERALAEAERRRLDDETAKLRTLAAEVERREREERIQIAEAASRAQAEKETRLREEQMRLDAQVKLAERKQKPVWLFAVAGLAVVGLLGGSVFFYQQHEQNKARHAQLEAEKTVAQEAAKRLEAEILALETEQAQMTARQAELDAELARAGTDAERARIEAEKGRLAAQQDALSQKVATKRSRPKPAAKDEPLTKTRTNKIELGTGDNPLD